MRYRRFGRLGWQVSEIGYGMWGLGRLDRLRRRAHSRARWNEAVRLGCNFFDTAWAYGEGHSERLLGELIRAHPDQRLYTATKIPPKNLTWPSRRGMRLDDVFPAGAHPRIRRALPREHRACEARPAPVSRLGRRLGATMSAGRALIDDLKRQGLITRRA